MRSLGRAIQNPLLSVATVVVFLGGAEGICRLLEPRAGEPATVAPEITDWALWEGDFYTVKSTAVGWPPFEDYNQDGLRDREHAVEKPAGVRRVVCLGDSTTVGYRIRPDQAYPQVLEDRLEALGRRVEVLNVALGGWSTRQERIAYVRIARKYQPDQVLVGVCLNDIPEIGNNLSRPPAWLAVLHRRSALVRGLLRASDREIGSVAELIQQHDAPKVKEAYRRFFAELRALRDEARGDGATFGVLVFPFRLQIEPDAPPPTPQRAITAFCAAERIACLDLLPTLREAGDRAFVDYDHFSPFGSEVVADAILASGLLAEESDPSLTPRWLPAAGLAEGRARSAGPEQAAPLSLLLDALAGPDPAARVQAARELGQRADAGAAAPALAARLKDKQASVRAAAAWALGRVGPRPDADVPALTHGLQDPDAAVRAGAAWALGRLGPPARAAGPALAQRLRDPDADVRRRAAAAFAQVKPDATTCLPTLLAQIEDKQAPGRAEAARALAALGPAAVDAVGALARCLREGNDDLRRETVGAIEAIGPGASSAVPALITAFDDPVLRWRVPDALGAIGPGASLAVTPLTAALGDANATVRWRAARALGRIGPAASGAAEGLARLTTDPQDNVRAAAVTALGRVGADPEFCVRTLGATLADPDSEVRKRAADALGQLAVPAAVPSLISTLHDPDLWVRVSAVRALGRTGKGSSAASEALRQALRDDEEMVREEATRALKRIR